MLTEELENSRGGVRDQLKEKDAKINSLIEELGNSQAMLNDKVAELAEVPLTACLACCTSSRHKCALSLKASHRLAGLMEHPSCRLQAARLIQELNTLHVSSAQLRPNVPQICHSSVSDCVLDPTRSIPMVSMHSQTQSPFSALHGSHNLTLS